MLRSLRSSLNILLSTSAANVLFRVCRALCWIEIYLRKGCSQVANTVKNMLENLNVIVDDLTKESSFFRRLADSLHVF